MYTYKIIKEDFYTGICAKRTRTICRNRPLEVGGLVFPFRERLSRDVQSTGIN